MQCLRASTLIARLVLAWFVATLGIAMASPLVTPQQLQVVCTDMGGLKLIVVHGDQDALSGPAHHTLDCPACLSVAPHTPFRTFRLARPSPRSEAPHPLAAAHPAWATGAPLPPRGPPTA